MEQILKYDVELPETVSDILTHDFWLFDNFNAAMLGSLTEPVKFSAFTSIYVKQGECVADIDLVSYKIKAPCIVLVRKGQILQPSSYSSDFDASFIVLSKRMTDHVFMYINNALILPLTQRFPVVEIDDELREKYDGLFDELRQINDEADHEFPFQSVAFTLTTFFYRTAYKSYKAKQTSSVSRFGRIATKFISLVQMNFRKQRFLEFYASELGITTKHLSRTVKSDTGHTAAEWIERFVILEAKVMLRSSNLTIQQISNELNFPTQSFFGKYFKKHVGQSPKEFRNM